MRQGAPPLPEKALIAVLTFDNMSGDPEQEYFADSMAEHHDALAHPLAVCDRPQFDPCLSDIPRHHRSACW